MSKDINFSCKEFPREGKWEESLSFVPQVKTGGLMWVPRSPSGVAPASGMGEMETAAYYLWAADRERADGHLCTHVGLQTSEHRT